MNGPGARSAGSIERRDRAQQGPGDGSPGSRIAPAGGTQGPTVAPAGGTLYVVATPIGNLADVTERALEVLRRVPLVAAEDTRLTRRLWARHGIATRLVSYHARNAATRGEELLAHLASGADLALVTDAGTPLVSDPGGQLVSAWVDAGGTVVAVPGPSAVLAALVSSGIPAPRWGFEGFLPRSGRERRERIERIAGDDRATVLFEAPGRVADTLRDLAAVCGPDRRASLSRELTKVHEETWRGTLGELAERAATGSVRGEVTIVVAGRSGELARRSGNVLGAPRANQPDAAAAGSGDESGWSNGTAGQAAELVSARARVDELVRSGLNRSSAARQVAAETGLPRRDLFRKPEG